MPQYAENAATPTPNGEAGAAGQVKHLKGPGSIVAAGELLARLEGMELGNDFGEDSVCNNFSLLCFQRDGRIEDLRCFGGAVDVLYNSRCFVMYFSATGHDLVSRVIMLIPKN